MTLSYIPKFQHTDWVDNVDRVQASGDNGFNIRFHALEAEFALLADVIKRASDALDALAETPPATPVQLTLTPTLTTLSDPWEHVFGGARKPRPATDASGLMAVSLPHGVTIQTLRVCGQKDAGNLSVNLRRQSLAAGATTELIVGLTLSNGNFDSSTLAPSAPLSKVDNEQFRYYLTAELDSGTSNTVVQLTCFQITYISS